MVLYPTLRFVDGSCRRFFSFALCWILFLLIPRTSQTFFALYGVNLNSFRVDLFFFARGYYFSPLSWFLRSLGIFSIPVQRHQFPLVCQSLSAPLLPSRTEAIIRAVLFPTPPPRTERTSCRYASPLLVPGPPLQWFSPRRHPINVPLLSPKWSMTDPLHLGFGFPPPTL